MAYRYRQIYPQTGEVLNPQDWNLNQKEIAEEFNGYLDRDNLPDLSIDLSHVKLNAITKVRSDSYLAASPMTTTARTIQWQNNDGTNDIGEITFESPVDCLLICEFGVSWEPTAGTDSSGDIRFRITADGVAVSETHFISGDWDKWSIHIAGAIPVSAGFHTIRAECQVAAMNVTGTQKYGDTDWVFELQNRELVVIERKR